MKNVFKEGFTLIELLAVIIILAVIALIATPVVLKVVDNAKESARKSSVSGYADTVRLALVEKQFETGFSPNINQTFLDSLSYQGEEVSCSEVINSSKYGVILHECNVGSDTNKYCFVMGKVYECGDETYTNIYNEAKNGTGNENPDDETTEVGYKDNSGANSPELYDKMIPVVYNTTTDKWTYANINEKWYDYDAKEWANAVVLNPGASYSVGQDIEMTDIGMMYVWIPRYKYIIFNGNNGSIDPQEINVTFESGTAKTGTVTCTENALGSGSSSETCSTITNNVSTYTHPAFTFGDKELAGIWVGKFEISTTDSACLGVASTVNCDKNTHMITVKPNVDSLRFANVSNLFTSILNIKTNYNMSNIDSHMMKNMEWGAVAYLTQSRYGRCTSGTCEEVWINNVRGASPTYTMQTGCAGNSVSAASSTTCQNQYHTTNGIKASTTGTIYGIYDMSGGAYDYVMGNMVDSSGNFYSSSAGFGSTPDAKYYDKYSYDSSSYTTHSRGRLGDATKETLQTYGSTNGGWYGDYTYFVNSSGSWFLRGGRAASTSSAGLFTFDRGAGGLDSLCSARSVVVAQ